MRSPCSDRRRPEEKAHLVVGLEFGLVLVLVELALDLKDAPGSPDASRSALWRFCVEVFADAELA